MNLSQLSSSSWEYGGSEVESAEELLRMNCRDGGDGDTQREQSFAGSRVGELYLKLSLPLSEWSISRPFACF